MASLQVVLKWGIRPSVLLVSFAVFCLVLPSFCYGVAAELSSQLIERTSPTATSLRVKLANLVGLVQIGDNLFVITPLGMIVGIVSIGVVLVVFFVIAFRRRWIEITFESVPEETVSVAGENERDVDERFSQERHGWSTDSLSTLQGAVEPLGGALAMEAVLHSEKDVPPRMFETISPLSLGRQVAKTELERTEAEIDAARMALEAERVKLEKASRSLESQYEALSKLKEELSAENEELTIERQRLERLRDQLTHEQVELGRARDELAEAVKVLSKTSLKGEGV